MATLIDTSILLAYTRGQIDMSARVAGRATEGAFVSVLSASELLYGAQWAPDPAVRARRRAFVAAILARLPMVEINLEVARAHAELWSHLAQQGEMVGVHDAWLAATCIAHDLTLATANLREFKRVPGLRVENWLTDAEAG